MGSPATGLHPRAPPSNSTWEAPPQSPITSPTLRPNMGSPTPSAHLQASDLLCKPGSRDPPQATALKPHPTPRLASAPASRDGHLEWLSGKPFAEHLRLWLWECSGFPPQSEARPCLWIPPPQQVFLPADAGAEDTTSEAVPFHDLAGPWRAPLPRCLADLQEAIP